MHSEPGLWTELVVAPFDDGLPAQSLPALQQQLERHATWAMRPSIFHGLPGEGPLQRITAAAHNITALELHHICQPSTAAYASRRLAASGTQPSSAMARSRATAPQLPGSVEELEVQPGRGRTGWAWDHQLALDASSAPANP